jgi:hypothetical protein
LPLMFACVSEGNHISDGLHIKLLVRFCLTARYVPPSWVSAD